MGKRFIRGACAPGGRLSERKGVAATEAGGRGAGAAGGKLSEKWVPLGGAAIVLNALPALSRKMGAVGAAPW